METDVIRTLLAQRPWKTIEIVLSSGDRHKVSHPEHIGVVPGLVVIADQHGPSALIDPASVVAVEPPRNGARGRRN